jgi:transcriptional regulator with XRE-family HTH domain
MGLFQRLKDLREDRDMAQKQIAAVLGIDQRVYSNYETGKRDIPVRHLIKLADYYGVSADYLLGMTNEKRPYPRPDARK